MKTRLRFERKLRKTWPGCWLWTGAKKPSGYGNFYLDGNYVSAHRASWLLFRGPIPDGLAVCHTCDVPQCVNPDHLFVATAKENVRDMMIKGRSGCVARGGEYHPVAKLTWKAVKEMRSMRAAGSKLQEIADRFNISVPNASVVCAGKTWANECGVFLDELPQP